MHFVSIMIKSRNKLSNKRKISRFSAKTESDLERDIEISSV